MCKLCMQENAMFVRIAFTCMLLDLSVMYLNVSGFALT